MACVTRAIVSTVVLLLLTCKFPCQSVRYMQFDRSVLSAAQELNIPNVHLLVVGPQAPNVVPDMVTKIRHLAQGKGGTDEEKVHEAIEDSIADDTCTHVLMATKAGGETSPVLTEASKRFVGALVPDVVAIESRGKASCCCLFLVSLR